MEAHVGEVDHPDVVIPDELECSLNQLGWFVLQI